MLLPKHHTQRFDLNHELHARPFAELRPPAQASYLALLAGETTKPVEEQCLAELCACYGRPPPSVAGDHYSADLGPFEIKWERHTEFTSYTFLGNAPSTLPSAFANLVIDQVPQQWLAALPGTIIAAAHVAVLPAAAGPPPTEEVTPLFGGNPVVGARIGDGAGAAYTDFRIHDDGFSRFLIFDVHLTSRQGGRMLQRMLEVETYVMLALLTFPLARGLLPELSVSDRRLAEITTRMAEAIPADEPTLLDRLTRLAAEIEHSVSSTHYRFGAARAYYALVEQRIAELREVRIEGVQTFREFTERRLAPAMNTCESVARLQSALSERIDRASQLLRTRVEVEREQQNLALLASMDRRARLQLRLQQTVEGLSVAAVTYYTVGLIGYFAKAGKTLGVALNPDLVMAGAIPLVALLAALGVRHIRRTVSREGGR
ncbi:MAG: hypothetical protein A3G24_21225 [Betaproteobacteria bacterium RIFCSPLOWO2_12_FULL_62_13]|nr:MAG: hypothetical protein A3G24_21225 [Betaproteobacteria bacterium RIFCSPLOWO2_12_FULL_62_13]